ncbi:MAG TPA: helix-turn-helix transcriptional regulator [Solirubrobacteraceae bacterium]|nr:helix-turn-helix transcriptional regulator [Solirubrobacteraceae bacterium]
MSDVVSSSALGRAIRERRASLGLAAHELSAKSSFEAAYLESVERGERNPSLRNLSRLASALGMPLSALVTRAEQIDAQTRSGPTT